MFTTHTCVFSSIYPTTPLTRKIHTIIFFILICTILATMLHAQPNNVWMHFYDNNGNANYFYDVFATTNGGYAMCGFTPAEQGNSAYWLVIVDENGGEIWQRTYSHERFPDINNWCYSLIQDDNGGFLIGGRVRDQENLKHFSVLRTEPDGNMMWWREYGEPGWAAECWAVIELKTSEFVAVGRNGNFDAYAIMLNDDGDVLWEQTYQDLGKWFRSLREVAGGLLLVGWDNGHRGWILKTNFEGEVLWSQSYQSGQLMSLISCREGGFAASGHITGDQNGWYLLRVDEDGNEIWSSTYDFVGNEWSNCVTQMWDNGFTLVGEAQEDNESRVLRTDVAGNEVWRRSDGNEEEMVWGGYKAVVVGHDGMALAVGTGLRRLDDNRVDGVLTKIMLEVFPPEIIFHVPEDIELNVLQGDTIQFAVQAEDMQDDSLSYFWILDDDTVATDTTTMIIFEELGDHRVECFVSEGELADSVLWLVHVNEFFIRNYEPDSLELTIQRGTEIDFGIDIAAIEEIEVENTWIITHRNQQQEEIGNEGEVTVMFDQSGRHLLQAQVSYEDATDEVSWIISVRSAIWSWWPSELELSAYVDSTFEFVITPFNEESDSLEYAWLLDNEPMESDSASIRLTFPETGQREVTSIVHDGIEADTILWSVNVEEWSFTADDSDFADLPVTAQLYPGVPNPFNSSVRLSMYLPRAEHVLLSVFDVNGREVLRLVDGDFGAGSQTFVWNGGGFPAGVYFLQFYAGEIETTQKILLVK